MTTLKSEQERFAEVYRTMAPFYRPAAPSDGYGNITVPREELNLEREAREWAARMAADADTGRFRIGCPDYPLNRMFALGIELARCCAGADAATVKRLAALIASEAREL